MQSVWFRSHVVREVDPLRADAIVPARATTKIQAYRSLT